MAGEWIKVETGLPEKPEVMRLARLLGMKTDQTVGVLVRFWIWADRNTVDGVVDGVVSTDVDAVLSCPGLCRALEMVGWLTIEKDPERITIPKFGRHNGESAKKRALKNERQARWRDTNVDSDVDAPASTKASTREEKRRSNKEADPPNGGTVWDLGVTLLQEQGLRESSARTFLGSCLREWNPQDVEAAFRSAAGKADVKAYVLGVLKAVPKKNQPAIQVDL